MAERDEPDVSPLGRDATVRHIRLIRSQLKRLSSNDPDGTTEQPTQTPGSDRGQTAGVAGFSSTAADRLDPDRGPGAPGNAALDLIEAELVALRERIAVLETHLEQLRAAATDQGREEPG